MALNVQFNNQEIEKIYFNGEEIHGLYFNGTKIFPPDNMLYEDYISQLHYEEFEDLLD